MHALTLVKAALLGATLVCLAAGAGLAVPSTARAVADVRVNDPLDCLLHPRKIAIQNYGDTAQNLAGWKLLSNKPGEEFDLSVVGTVAPGDAFFVFNGHQSPPAPEQIGSQWIYPWNYTPVLDESFFVLFPDGSDFIRLVDATGYPWREVSNMRCPDNTNPIPPLQQPQTPTPAPSNPDPGAGNSGQTDPNQAASAQTDGTQSTGASQNAPSANTAGGSGAGSAAQTGNVSGQAAGGPASGVGALQLQVGGGQPLDGRLLPLGVLGVLAAAVLALLGLRMLRRGWRRP